MTKAVPGGATTRVVSASRRIPAPAEAIFDVLAHPDRHREIDGSGTVRGASPASPRLAPGATFSMAMRMFGVNYTMTNHVVEFEEGRRIAWRHFGRHIWRYVLEPADDGSTLVTESFDWSDAPVPAFYEIVGYPRLHEANMVRTLERLERVVTT